MLRKQPGPSGSATQVAVAAGRAGPVTSIGRDGPGVRIEAAPTGRLTEEQALVRADDVPILPRHRGGEVDREVEQAGPVARVGPDPERPRLLGRGAGPRADRVARRRGPQAPP